MVSFRKRTVSIDMSYFNGKNQIPLSRLDSDWNGTAHVKSMYIMTPRFHTSTRKSYPLPLISSGATSSLVPQGVSATLPGSIVLESP